MQHSSVVAGLPLAGAAAHACTHHPLTGAIPNFADSWTVSTGPRAPVSLLYPPPRSLCFCSPHPTPPHPTELDFEHEARNSVRCAANLNSKQSRVRGRVAVPGVDRARTSHRVLTMEFIEGGVPLTLMSYRLVVYSTNNLIETMSFCRCIWVPFFWTSNRSMGSTAQQSGWDSTAPQRPGACQPYSCAGGLGPLAAWQHDAEERFTWHHQHQP